MRSTRIGTTADARSVDGADPLLINAKAAQDLLCIGERQLWFLTNCKAIPSFKIGKSVRYSPAELEAWVACGCPTAPGSAELVRKAVRK